MTDQGQGYPPYGEPGGGGQQPQYPGRPGYGAPPPGYGPPPPGYWPPPPGYWQQPPQPQQPQYPGQPGYGAPPPGYPPPGYGGPGGPTGPGGPGDRGAAAGGNRKGIYAAIAVAVAVAVAVAAYFVFSGGSASASSPKDAVKKLLEAGKKNNINAAKKVLCSADIALGTARQLGSKGRILSYEIGKTSNKNGITLIEVTASTTENPTPGKADFPVVKEDGKWKVCFTKAVLPLPTGLPTGLPSGLPSRPTDTGFPTDIGVPTDTGLPTGSGFPTSLPSSIPGGLSICSGSTSALAAAESYVGAAEVGLTQFAQSCVYEDSVPLSVTTSLNGKLYASDTSASPNANQFVFKSTDRTSTVTIMVTKESDGHFYITGVRKS